MKLPPWAEAFARVGELRSSRIIRDGWPMGAVADVIFDHPSDFALFAIPIPIRSASPQLGVGWPVWYWVDDVHDVWRAGLAEHFLLLSGTPPFKSPFTDLVQIFDVNTV